MSAEDIGNLDDLLTLSLKKAEACIEDAQKLADEGEDTVDFIWEIC